MKKLYLLLVLIGTTFQLTISQTIGVDQLHVIGNRGWDLVSDMAIDNNGNYYLTGSFSGEIKIGGTTLTSSGERDIFIVKLDNENNISWAKKLGGEFDEHSHAINYSNNQLYLSGSFNKSINFTGQIDAIGGTDAFFAQLSADGNVIWTKALHGEAGAYKVLLKNTSQGDIIIGGKFEKKLWLDPNTSIEAVSGKDFYWARYNAGGNLQTHIHIGGEGDENLEAIAIDGSDNIHLGGSYEKTMVFGTKVLNSYGGLDLFYAKYDINGGRFWYKITGSIYNEGIKSLTLDGQGNIYAAIGFDLCMRFVGTPYYAASGSDVAILKSNEGSGVPIWVRQLGGTSKNTVSSITCGNNKVYISGNFSGEFQPGDKYKSEGIFEDAYVASFASDGTFSWFKKAGGSGEDNVWLQYLPQNGRLVCTGYFSDDFALANYQSTTNNFSEVFFGTLIDCDLVPHVNLGADRTICSGTELQVEGEFVSYSWEHSPVPNSFGSPTTASIIPETTGTYTVTVEDSYGCESTDAIDLTIILSPEFDLGEDIILPENATLTLDPELGEGPYSYLWSTGSTEAVLNLPMSTISAPTTISLTVTAGNNCEYADEVVVSREESALPAAMLVTDNMNTTDKITNANTTELDNQKVYDYKIYPNPGDGIFYISGERLKNAQQIDVFSSSGNHVKSCKNINIYPFKLDLSFYPKGTYFIKISETTQAFEFKVILK